MRLRQTAAILVIASAAAGLAGCATSSSTPPAPAATHAAIIDTAPPFSAEGVVCAGLNALIYTGAETKAQAYATVEQAYGITRAQVARAAHDKCQQYQ